MAITQILSHPQLDRRVIRAQGLPRPQRDSRTGTIYQKIHCKPLQGFSTPLIRTPVGFFYFLTKVTMAVALVRYNPFFNVDKQGIWGGNMKLGHSARNDG